MTPQSSDGALAAHHGVGDFGAEPLGKHAGFAYRAERADMAEEFIDTLGVKDVAAGEFADDCCPVLIGLEADFTHGLVICRDGICCKGTG
jgi:hypothetical protein